MSARGAKKGQVGSRRIVPAQIGGWAEGPTKVGARRRQGHGSARSADKDKGSARSADRNRGRTSRG